jgi:hypothetical protein
MDHWREGSPAPAAVEEEVSVEELLADPDSPVVKGAEKEAAQSIAKSLGVDQNGLPYGIQKSARGGRGGVVTSAASLWAGILEKEEVGVIALLLP